MWPVRADSDFRDRVELLSHKHSYTSIRTITSTCIRWLTCLLLAGSLLRVLAVCFARLCLLVRTVASAGVSLMLNLSTAANLFASLYANGCTALDARVLPLRWRLRWPGWTGICVGLGAVDSLRASTADSGLVTRSAIPSIMGARESHIGGEGEERAEGRAGRSGGVGVGRRSNGLRHCSPAARQ